MIKLANGQIGQSNIGASGRKSSGLGHYGVTGVSAMDFNLTDTNPEGFKQLQ